MDMKMRRMITMKGKKIMMRQGIRRITQKK